MSLKSMFTTVVKRYDLLNRILTWGLDEVWRETCARECASGEVIVDLCCGTGDLALHILKHVAPEACVLGLDFSEAMLDRAVNKKSEERRRKRQIYTRQDKVGVDTPYLSFILADAAYLPFKDECIDCMGISFSFRNLVYRNPRAKICLREAVRTLRPRGRFVCVETSQPRRRPLRVLYHLYLRKVVPLVGWLISGRKGPYRYLGISAANFPFAEEVVDMLLNAGFREASFKHLAFGVVAMHVAVK